MLNEMGGAGAAQGLSWSWELDFAALLECLTEPGPHDPPGSRLGSASSGRAPAGPATVGSPPTIVNAICDALAPYGVRHMDMPCTPSRVWDAMRGKAAPAQ